MLSREEVRLGFMYLLGREPESDRIYESLQTLNDVHALRAVLVDSAEYRSKISGHFTGFLNRFRKATNFRSVAESSDDRLKEMFARIQQGWKRLGENDPHWSVLTDVKYRKDQIEKNLEQFYSSGKSDVDALFAALARNNLKIKKDGTCFELGCGVGRATFHLSKFVKKVIGWDISTGNLSHAGNWLKSNDVMNADLHLVRSMNEYENIPSFDLFFSNIVLQHNPPPVSRYMLDKICKAAAPGGILYFQIITFRDGYYFEIESYLRTTEHDMEVHCLQQKDVFSVLRACDCDLLEIMEDSWAGSGLYLSNTILARKRVGGSA